MRVVFMGTPDFSVPCLRALVAAGHTVSLVVTQPDRPKGRGLTLESSPVKRAALELGLPLFQPEKPNRPENVETVRAAAPDVLVVVAYGAILKEALLTLAPRGAVNVHASLLPKYRGMSPIHRAIWDGEPESGVTTMQMDAGVDTGDMLMKAAIPIDPNENCGELHDRLAALGADLLKRTLDGLAHGTVTAQPQSGAASYAGRIEKEHGLIDWSLPAVAVHNHARAVTPWPGATTRLAGEALVVKRTRVADLDGPASGVPFAGAPGTVLQISGPQLRVACGVGAVDLLELRPAGRPTMSGGDFARGRRLSPGARFEGGADGSR